MSEFNKFADLMIEAAYQENIKNLGKPMAELMKQSVIQLKPVIEIFFNKGMEIGKAQAVPEPCVSVEAHQIIIDEVKTEINEGYELCQDSYLLDVLVHRGIQIGKAQAVPEGFVLVLVKNVKYFSNDGENYEIHDTLAEAKHEAECAIEHFSERLADQLCDPREDGNFQNVGYGVVLGTSSYSIDHVVTQEDVENGEYGCEVGTEIMSLFLVEAQELTHESK